MKSITSHANPVVKKIKSLAQKKYRDEYGLFLVEGERDVRGMLDAGWEVETLAFTCHPERSEGSRVPPPEILRYAQDDNAIEVMPGIMQRMTGRDNAQDVLGVFRHKWHDLPKKDGVFIALDGVRDPGNLGTVIRTADAAGARGVILIGNTCDPWSPECIRATMGSIARVPLMRADASGFIAWKKSWPGRVIGTHLKGAEDYRRLSYAPPLAIVMGSEQSGLSPDIAAACDQLARIPMVGGAESLNLAVSAGIMLYEAVRGKI
jgi:TrmH family RNA methyltransferase